MMQSRSRRLVIGLVHNIDVRCGLADKGPPKSREDCGFKPQCNMDVACGLIRVNDRGKLSGIKERPVNVHKLG